MTYDEFRDHLARQPLTLAYFSTDDCTMCKSLKPKVLDLLEDHPDWKWTYVDSMESPEVAGQLLVLSVPVIVLFVEGQETGRFGRHLSLYDLDHSLSRFERMFL